MNAETNFANPVEEQQNGVEHTRGGRCYRPNVDIFELPHELLLQADLPGLKSEDIDLHFEDGQLTIHGRVPARASEESKYLRQEYGIGDFQRTFRVSEQIAADEIHANYQDGVLTLHLPKVAAAKPRKIAVQVN